MRILIDNAMVLTMDRVDTLIPNGYILTENDIILEVGEGSCQAAADLRIDGRQGIVMPGMVNTHCHVSMIPFRTMGDDCADRLRKFLFPLELKAMTPELVCLSAKYGICEMLLSGVTTFLDMYYFEDQVAKACEELGIRGYLGETVINMETCDSREPYGGLAYGEKFLKEWGGHPLVTPLIAPHATNTNTPQKLKEAHELAKSYNTFLTLHVSEMDYEMEYFREQYEMTPVEFLDSIGVLDSHTIAAHCIHMTDEDLGLLKLRGCGIAHCIGSNTKAGKGIAPVKDMILAGIPVGLGTDGPSSGNTLSILTQFRLFASCQKTKYHDRSLFPAKEIVKLGTMGGAGVLRSEKTIGSLEAGKKADIVLLETDSINMFPNYNPYSLLVYSANDSNVDTVLVDGKILVSGGKLAGVDLRDLRRQLGAASAEFNKLAMEYADII